MATIHPKNAKLNSKTLIWSKHWICAIIENNLNGFWDFYHDINLGVGSPKALFMSMLLGKESNFFEKL
jgi:hypothetical protein